MMLTSLYNISQPNITLHQITTQCRRGLHKLLTVFAPSGHFNNIDQRPNRGLGNNHAIYHKIKAKGDIAKNK